MTRFSMILAVLLILGSSGALAQNGPVVSPSGGDDGQGLNRGGDRNSVTISGVSSGAAMAMQYAVAHSASIAGVGAIAGPGWGCAEGQFSTALDGCMCGRQPVDSKFIDAIKMAYDSEELFDPMDPRTGKPKALQRSYVFHSSADITVVKESGEAAVRFLRDFTGKSPKVDKGNKSDGSNQAGHGILSPYGTDSCALDGKETTYIRNCRKHDNAGRLFRELYGKLSTTKSRMKVPATIAEVWEFPQQALIDAIKQDPFSNPIVASDVLLPFPQHSEERKNFDLASTGYLYVPSECRSGERQCRVHIALHGCKQDPRTFAMQAGYNYWAEKYDVIVVYPAIKAYQPQDLEEGQICRISKAWTPNEWKAFDGSWAEANYNGCWDWWGYLDLGDANLEGTKTRYLTKRGPQMQVIDKIIDAVTLPLR